MDALHTLGGVEGVAVGNVPVVDDSEVPEVASRARLCVVGVVLVNEALISQVGVDDVGQLGENVKVLGLRSSEGDVLLGGD